MENNFKFSFQEENTINLLKTILKNNTKLLAPETYFKITESLKQIWNTEVNLYVDFSAIHKCMLMGGGCYSPELKTISLFIPSILVLLHEFKHHLQIVYPQYTKISNPEIDAILWSVTITKLANPKHYQKMLINNTIFLKNIIDYDLNYPLDFNPSISSNFSNETNCCFDKISLSS